MDFSSSQSVDTVGDHVDSIKTEDSSIKMEDSKVKHKRAKKKKAPQQATEGKARLTPTEWKEKEVRRIQDQFNVSVAPIPKFIKWFNAREKAAGACNGESPDYQPIKLSTKLAKEFNTHLLEEMGKLTQGMGLPGLPGLL